MILKFDRRAEPGAETRSNEVGNQLHKRKKEKNKKSG